MRTCSLDGRELLSGQLGRRLELAQVGREVVRVERLRAVADGLLGLGWISTMMPSAPAAAAASDSGSTSERFPAAWLGSITIGRCVSSRSTGTAIRSSVKR